MLLGIDLETGSAKALLLETDGTAIGEASSSYPIHTPFPGWAESEPAHWWSGVASAVRKAVGNHADQVQAIALSGQMHGVVLADKSADTAAVALGNGLLPGLVQLTIGTAAQIITPRSQPIIDPHGRTHLYRAAVPNQWYTLAAMQNAGLALEWARGILGLSWQQVYTKAFSVPPGCEGLTFLPYLTGERTPHLDPYVRGAWVGLGLHHTQAHLMRAALEGVAFALRQGFEALEATGFKATELRLAGGGTVEMPWKQLLTDVLRIPLYATTVAAASARGAALLAGIGIGVYADAHDTLKLAATPTLAATPQSVNSALEDAWMRYKGLYPRLSKI